MFVGIAYAIATPDLDRIVTGLIAEPRPPVPELGLRARPVDRQVAEAVDVAVTGLLVDGVEAGGLAAAAGLVGGDIILGVDGTDLAEPGDLAFALEQAAGAGTAELAVLRAGEPLTLTLALTATDEPAGLRLREVPMGQPKAVATYRLSALGVVLDDEGQVTAVTESSPALYAGLAKGDRILTVNGQAVDLGTYEITEPVLILVAAPGGATRHIYLDPWGAMDGVRPIGGANVLDPDVVVF